MSKVSNIIKNILKYNLTWWQVNWYKKSKLSETDQQTDISIYRAPMELKTLYYQILVIDDLKKSGLTRYFPKKTNRLCGILT